MDNEGAIAAWKLDLEEIRRVFDVGCLNSLLSDSR